MPPGGGNFAPGAPTTITGGLSSAVENIGKFNTSFQTANPNVTQQTGNGYASAPANVSSFFSKVGNVFSETTHMFEGATSWVGRQVIDAGKGVIHAAEMPVASFHLGQDAYNNWQYGQQVNQNVSDLNNLNSQYNKGLLSQSDYKAQLDGVIKNINTTHQDYGNLSTKISSDGKTFAQDGIATVGALVTYLTAGLDTPLLGIGTKAAGDFLAGDAAKASVDPVIGSMIKLASNKATMDALPSGVQNAIRSSITDSFMNIATNKTATDLAKSSAVDLLVKYPIAFNYLNGTGSQVLNQMEKGKYGDAVGTLAFNAGILLAGGPIGKALGDIGKSALGGLKDRIFGSTSFLDTLSKGMGYGVNDMYNAIKDNPATIKAFQALEATNVKASNGSTFRGAYRVINGMKSVWGDAQPQTAQDLVKNVMGWHEAQSYLKSTLINKGYSEAAASRYVVGRWTINDAKSVATMLSQKTLGTNESAVATRLKAWEDYKTANPNSAFANNHNLDTQIKGLIRQNKDPQQLTNSILNIKAQYAKYADLNAKDAKFLADKGYVPIMPKNLEAPFVQGEQKLLTSADIQNNEFFVNGVKQLPVLGGMADFLTKVGLSPEKSSQTVQEVFNTNLAKNLEETNLVKDIKTQNDAYLTGTAEAKSAIGRTDFTPGETKSLAEKGITPADMTSNQPTTMDINKFSKMFSVSKAEAKRQLGNLNKEDATTTPEGQRVLNNTTPFRENAKGPDAPKDTSYKLSNNIMGAITNKVNAINQVAQHINLHLLPVNDIRQLTLKQIGEALQEGGITTGLDLGAAKEVQQSMMDAMLSVPVQVKGLGNKFLDQHFMNHFAAREYMKLQGALRFAWNPFFKMKLAAKTEILSQMESGGKLPSAPVLNGINRLIFHEKQTMLDNTATILDRNGFFSGGYTNELADQTALLTGSKPTQILQSQKISIAGLVDSMSTKLGMNTEQFIQMHPNQVRDVTEMILHYNPKADFLNSPLARTLNFAFFPFRFNLKVSEMMTRTLVRQDALTQLAVVHGVMQAHQFLTSQQGQVWYQHNADVIQLLGYFTPLETLHTVMALGNIGKESVGALGELGGLPLGFITTLLNSEGLLHTSTPYVDPKTGKASSNYIPITAKAKLATAISSFLSSLFTYPGSIVGLPSKTKTVDNTVNAVFGVKTSSDFNVIPETNLTPQQVQYQQAIGALQSTTQGQATPQLISQTSTVPSMNSATAQPYYKKTNSSTAPSKKLKKSQEPLQLLPGQTKIGQL